MLIKPSRFMSLLLAGIIGFSIFGTACSGSSGTGVVRFEALAGPTPLVDSSPGEPIRLDAGETLEMTLLLTNVTSIPIDLASVVLEGRLLGLPFVSSRTGVDETILPGEERLIRFPIDLHGVDAQAHGLLRGRLVVSGPDGTVLQSQPAVLDVQGRPTAVTTLLAVAFFAVGIVGMTVAAFRYVAGTLPEERRLRGLQLVPPGLSFGLGLSAVSSVARLWPLPAALWLLGTAALGFAFYVAGVYLPPSGGPYPSRLAATDSTSPRTRNPSFS